MTHREKMLFMDHAGMPISLTRQCELLEISRASVYYRPVVDQQDIRIMGIETIYPRTKPNTSQANLQHRKYPYLLKGLPIVRPNQVFGTDITYVKSVLAIERSKAALFTYPQLALIQPLLLS